MQGTQDVRGSPAWDPRRLFEGRSPREKVIASIGIACLALAVVLLALYAKKAAPPVDKPMATTSTQSVLDRIDVESNEGQRVLEKTLMSQHSNILGGVGSEQQWRKDLKEIIEELDALKPQIAAGDMPFAKINALIAKIEQMTQAFPLLGPENEALRGIIRSLEDFKFLYNHLSASDTYYNVTQIMINNLDAIRSRVCSL